MGQSSQHKPARLAEKLLFIRNELHLSQNDLIRCLGTRLGLTQARISAYERGVREPPLIILLEYARAANVYVDTLIDDEIDLPERLPSHVKSEGIRKKPKTKKARKD